MAWKRRHHESLRWVTFASLVAIALAAVALVGLGVDAARRQREAVSALAESNRRLLGQRIAGELEALVRERAEACLDEPGVREAVAIAVDAETPAEIRGARRHFEAVASAHPIARHFFVLDASGARFPLTRDLPRSFAPHTDSTRQFRRLIEEAESLEIIERDVPRALERYAAASRLETTAPSRALALSRMARCQRKLGADQDAARLYHLIAEEHGDDYDRFHRPYGLVAALALGETPTDLYQGRWELSGQQLDFFEAALPLQENLETEFVDHLALGRALEADLQRIAPGTPTRLSNLTLSDRETPRQIFFTTIGNVTVGFEADLEWIATALLPEALAQGGVDAATAHLQLAAADGIAFRSMFPFWTLELELPSKDSYDGLFATAIGLVLCVLVLGLFVVVRDASRERKLGQLRSDLVSGVSHELKTPLTLIRLYAETLLHGGQHTEEERQGFHRIILREGERLSHLVDKVLHFARIQRRQREYFLEEGDLAAVVADTVDAYEEYLTRRGFNVVNDLETELPPVKFDAGAVSQAVVNLVDNAVKYSRDEKHVRLRLYREQSFVVFEVEDHGVGIPAEDRERIFEQFYRGNGSETGGGYGLGLFLVAHIMEAHGGRVWVESEPKRGSTFRLVFPIAEEPVR